MTITLRGTKGSALTHAELDGNFTDLNGRVTTAQSAATAAASAAGSAQTTANSASTAAGDAAIAAATAQSTANAAAGTATWGGVGGTLAAQTDLANALAAKQASSANLAAVSASDLHFMPAPTGVAATDQANLAAFFAGAKKVAVFLVSGVYLMNASINWTTGKRLVSMVKAHGAVELRMDAASTSTWMFVNTAGNADFGAEWITFNAQRDVRNAATGTTACGILDFGVGNPGDSYWERVTFRNTGTQASTFTGTGTHDFNHCRWITAHKQMLVVVGTKARVLNGYFYDQNRGGGTTGPCIQMQPGAGAVRSEVTTIGSQFWSVTDTGFAIEVVIGVGNGPDGHKLIAIGNRFDANYVGGSGISGPFDNTIIEGNWFYRGSYGHRSGLEIAGSNCSVIGNVFEVGAVGIAGDSGASSGAIVAMTASDEKYGRGNRVIGNRVIITAAAKTNLFAYAICQCRDSVMADNSAEFNISGTAALASAFSIGTFGNPWTLRNVSVRNNKVRVFSTSSGYAGNGYRLLTGVGVGSSLGIDYSDGVKITGNEAIGCAVGLVLPSTANDTNLLAIENDFSQCVTAINGTATGVGCIVDGTPNKRPVSTLSDFPAAASQAEAEAGTSTALRIFTPQRIAQAIAALAPAVGGGALNIQDEGAALTTAATTLNFVGSAVTASGTGAVKVITINAQSPSSVLSFMAGASTADAPGVRTLLGLGTAALAATGDFSPAAHNHTGVYQPLSAVLTGTTASFTTADKTKLDAIPSGVVVVSASRAVATTDAGQALRVNNSVALTLDTGSMTADGDLLSLVPTIGATYTLVVGTATLRTRTGGAALAGGSVISSASARDGEIVVRRESDGSYLLLAPSQNEVFATITATGTFPNRTTERLARYFVNVAGGNVTLTIASGQFPADPQMSGVEIVVLGGGANTCAVAAGAGVTLQVQGAATAGSGKSIVVRCDPVTANAPRVAA